MSTRDGFMVILLVIVAIGVGGAAAWIAKTTKLLPHTAGNYRSLFVPHVVTR